jgi:recombination protein RecA
MAEFEILYGKGISKIGELIDLGVANGIVEKSGAWYSDEKDRIGQGKENARAFLEEHPEIAVDIETRLRELLLPQKKTAEEPVKA